MRIVHVTRSDAFAGTERYAADVCTALAERGHEVTMVGGDPSRMPAELGPDVAWRLGSTTTQAVRSTAAAGRADLVHAHLTAAELAAVVTRPRHGGAVVATRHIAGPRGAGWLGPLLARGIDVQIAISATVDARLERPAGVVLLNGVRCSESPYDTGSRQLLVLQRLEPEKDTATALEAWRRARLWEQGWSLVLAGDGTQRADLERSARDLPKVSFLGRVDDVPALLARSGLLLATAVEEPLGLSVLEAMAAGVPVLATDTGGHAETRAPGAPCFRPGDVEGAAAALRALASDDAERRRLSDAVRRQQRSRFSLDRHVEALLEVYASARASSATGPRRSRRRT